MYNIKINDKTHVNNEQMQYYISVHSSNLRILFLEIRDVSIFNEENNKGSKCISDIWSLQVGFSVAVASSATQWNILVNDCIKERKR